MKNAKLFLCFIPPLANWIAIITLFVWSLKAAWLDSLPPLFPKSHELGTIVDGLLSSIEAGYVFFVLFALLPDFRERRSIAPIISKQMRNIIDDCNAIILELQLKSDTEFNFSCVTRQLTEEVLIKATFNKNPNMMVGVLRLPANWYQYFSIYRQHTEKSIDLIQRHVRYYSADLAKIIANLEENSFFSMCRSFEETQDQGIHFGIFADQFFEYITICQELVNYYSNVFLPLEGKTLKLSSNYQSDREFLGTTCWALNRDDLL